MTGSSSEAKSRIFRNCDKKMPFDNFTCVLRTHFKKVLDIMFTNSFIKKDDAIPACKR